MELGREKGFEVEAGKDFGTRPINVAWHMAIHSALRDIICGFIVMKLLTQTVNKAVARGKVKTREDFEDDRRWQEYRDKEAAMQRIRSGMDRVCLVAENEEAAKAISGKIECFASHGSLLHMDAVNQDSGV